MWHKMRQTPRLITSVEMRRLSEALITDEECQKFDDIVTKRIGDRARARALSYGDFFACLGNDPPSDHHTIPDEILNKAIINDAREGIELLALGKPAGDIFDPEHWMYDSVRDHFYALDVYDTYGIRSL